MQPIPTYLRVVITTRCPLACSYCHMEGDPAQPGVAGGLPLDEWIPLLHAGLDNGIRKLKFLGGEPLVRRDLPEIIAALRQRDPALDISIITSGAVPRERIDACFAAGLSRANVSVHGFLPDAFARRGGVARTLVLRSAFLDALLEHGRPLKLNYVYSGPQDEDDLAALLAFCRGLPLVINLLDDLSRPDLSHRSLVEVLERLVGPVQGMRREPDPHSLDTLHLLYGGLEIEIKDRQLGEQAPYHACGSCSLRRSCREGIHALRLSHTGVLRPCMDRPDLGLQLLPILAAGGQEAVAAAWWHHVRALLDGSECSQRPGVPGRARRSRALPVLADMATGEYP